VTTGLHGLVRPGMAYVTCIDKISALGKCAVDKMLAMFMGRDNRLLTTVKGATMHCPPPGAVKLLPPNVYNVSYALPEPGR